MRLIKKGEVHVLNVKKLRWDYLKDKHWSLLGEIADRIEKYIVKSDNYNKEISLRIAYQHKKDKYLVKELQFLLGREFVVNLHVDMTKVNQNPQNTYSASLTISVDYDHI